jgi:CRISPR-associated protein Csb2
MSTHLCITVRWIGDRFHGFIDGTETIEWPPAPFRLFQAFVASAHRHGMTESRRQGLEWIERQQNAPELLAVADPATGVIFDHWVLDNDNLVAHRKGSIRKFKPVLHSDRPLVHYVWPINPADQPPIDSLDDLAATLGWFGWAIDAAYATVTLGTVELLDSKKLPDNPLCRFQPVARTTRTDSSLRVAKPGSAAELERLHAVNRISFSDQTQRRKKKWPKVFNRVIYTTPDRSPPRPHAVFKLVDDNDDTFRYPHAKLIHIAGMVRHLAIKAMDVNNGDPPPWIEDPAEWVNRVVRGKRDPSSADEHRQFSYVPLPSIGHAHADAMIRNVMIVAPLGMDRELAHLAERLSDEALEPEGEFEACEADTKPGIPQRIELRKFTPPKGKFIDTRYLGTSRTWHSVTPVILDGHDDKKRSKTEKLIQTALGRTGIESPCEFTLQAIPFLKNCLSAHKYDRDGRHTGYHRPAHLKDRTAIHVRLTFTHPVPGPLAIGAGRHCGLGLFAAVDPQQQGA